MDNHYYQHDTHLKRHKLVRRLKWFGWGAVVTTVLLVIAFLIYSMFLVSPEEPVATSSAQTRVVSPGISVFRSPYFQFQASEDWIEVEDNDQNVFFYRLAKNNISEHDMTIYVNPDQRTINGLKAKHVYPVEPADGVLNPADDMSGSCGKGGKIKDNQIITLESVTFRCIAGSALFDVLAGQKGGGPLIEVERPDGSSINLAIYYRDLRATPTGSELKTILDSFQAR